MKKSFFLMLLQFFFVNIYSQEIKHLECGADEIMKKHYQRFPEDKIKNDAFNLELSNLIKKDKIQSKISQNTTLYEIPVVVHVISDGSPIGSVNNRSDDDIINWINYTNKVFAGDPSIGMSPASGVLPIKLVFAKIDPDCKTTNGINRINASHLPKYVSGGVNSDDTSNAVSDSEIYSLGMWDISKYYNIYVVKKLSSSMGELNGYAYGPGLSLDYSFISTGAVSLTKKTLAHEFGHALGLHHTQQGYNESTGACPSNNDCTLEGDMVCDTEPMVSLLYNSCQTNQINPCTNLIYAGGEKNVMAYSACNKELFTPGQAARAIAILLQYRQSLINSPVASLQAINNHSLLTSACTPSTIIYNGWYGIGITSVKFGNINNYSLSYIPSKNNFYEDFTKNYCLGISKTSIPLNSPTALTIAPGTNNLHTIKAYIDYNNDGLFNETTELILYQNGVNTNSPASALITPPANAVTNTPLRMRVIGELNNIGVIACYTPKYGQVEDYSVVIQSSTLSVNTIKNIETYITRLADSLVIKSDIKISELIIYDASGRILINRPHIKNNEIAIPLEIKNTVLTVKATLENGKVVTKKIKF